MRRLFLIFVLLPLSLLLHSTAAHGLSVRELYNVLEDRGLSFDAPAVQNAAVEAMLRAVDPGARFSSAAEMDALLDKPALLKAEDWPEGIRYLKIGAFSRHSTSIVERLEGWLEKGDASGIIMDLRGASGDNLDAVDSIAQLFLAGGTETYSVRDGRGRIVEQPKKAQGFVDNHVPVMLAVDSDTRGAAEVLAAVLKGSSRVLLLGGKTRGDMAIREVVPLPGGEAIYLSTKKVFASGMSTSSNSWVQPDIEITHYGRTSLPEKPPFGKTFSEKSLNDRKLMELVVSDAVLGSATDTLLGLKALGHNVAATNISSLAEK